MLASGSPHHDESTYPVDRDGESASAFITQSHFQLPQNIVRFSKIIRGDGAKTKEGNALSDRFITIYFPHFNPAKIQN